MSSKVFIYINDNTQSKDVLKNQKFDAQMMKKKNFFEFKPRFS